MCQQDMLGETREEVMEFDDKDSDEIIHDAYEEWVWNTVDAGWFIMEEEVDD